jgi:hypothetical protein
MTKYILPFALLGFINLEAQINNTNFLVIANQSNLSLLANNVNNVSNNRVQVIQTNVRKQINRNINPIAANQNKSNQIQKQTLNKRIPSKKVIIEPQNSVLNNSVNDENNYNNNNNYNPQIQQNQTETKYLQQAIQTNMLVSNNSKQIINSENNTQKIDLTISLKKSVSISKKSSYKKSKTYYNKWNKLKRKTFGKLASNKKTKFRVDLCFNWI